MLLYVENRCINNTTYYNFAYYQVFLDELTYRDSCYRCKYANIQRTGDITWGLGELNSLVKEEFKGISLVLIHTQKGNDFFKR